MNTLPFLMTDSTITVFVDGTSKTIDNTHPNFALVRDRIREGLFDGIGELFTIITAVKAFCGGQIEIDPDSGVVTYLGEEVHGSLTDRILSMMREGFDVQPLLNFLENLMLNPSKRAVDDLYGFLEYGKMPITADGCFLAYKRVRNDYKSVHDGKTDNSIGTIVEMPRNRVDEDPDSTCSYGLHFCSHEYLKSFSGEKVVVLKINPADVVAIPRDYNNTKGRACRYEVVGELTPDEVQRALSNSVWDTSVVTDYDLDDADRYDDEDEELLVGALKDERDAWHNTLRNSDVFVDGYQEGYDDGRSKRAHRVGFDSATHEDGYLAGYKDGRGHKSRKY